MEREDNLKAGDLGMQCVSIENAIYFNMDILSEYKRKLIAIQTDEELQGESYTSIKRQLEKYTVLINTISIANDFLFYDCQSLRNSIGHKNYIGHEIFDNIDNAIIKIDEYKKVDGSYWQKIHDTDNSWVKNFYEVLRDFNTMNIMFYEHVLKVNRRKIEEFDDIVVKTSNLFSQIDKISVTITTAIAGLSGIFQNGKYDNAAATKWEETHYRPLSDCVQRKDVCLNGGKFLTVSDDDEGTSDWFGGKLDAYKEFIKDPDEYRRFKRFGSGLLAATNFDEYLRRSKTFTSEDRMEMKQQHFTAALHGMYCMEKFFQKDYLSDREYPAIRPKAQERIGKDMQHVINEVAQSYGFKGAYWSTDSKLEIDQIKDQIRHGIPVLMLVDTVAPKNCSPLKMYQYYESTGTVKDFGVVEALGQYVTITGVQEYGDIHTGEIRQLLQVAHDGKERLIDFDEFSKYRQNRLSEINLLDRDDYLATGKNNISVVQY